MNENQLRVIALGMALFYLQNQNITEDLRTQGLSDGEIELAQRAYVELVDSIQYSIGLWGYNGTQDGS